MAKNLKNINGRFVESDFENALIAFLEAEGWRRHTQSQQKGSALHG